MTTNVRIIVTQGEVCDKCKAVLRKHDTLCPWRDIAGKRECPAVREVGETLAKLTENVHSLIIKNEVREHRKSKLRLRHEEGNR